MNTIANVMKLEKLMPVVDLEVLVKNTYPIEDKKTKDGTKEWKQQNIILSDETGEIMAQFNEPPFDLSVLKGKKIKLDPGRTKQGLKGCIVDEYTSAKKGLVRIIRLNQQCKMQTDLETHAIPQETPEKTPEKPLSKPPDWDGKERRSIRAMCLSYAKDLCIAGKIDIGQIAFFQDHFCASIYDLPEPESHDVREQEAQLKAEENKPDTLKEPDKYTEEIPF